MMSTAVARMHRQTKPQILRRHELERMRLRLLRKLPSSSWTDAQFVFVASVDEHGFPENTAIYAPWGFPCPPRADTSRCRMRQCELCGRWTPAGYMVRGPAPRETQRDRQRQVWQCQDCAIQPDDPIDEAYGPSPHHTFLEVARMMRIRSDGWSKKI